MTIFLCSLRRRTALASIAALVALSAPAVQAQTKAWPAKPITLIVPFPAGGPTDIVARTVAKEMSASLGQPMVVENRPGAGGTIGSSIAAHAAPDGYTLLVGTATSVTSAHLFSRLNYDPLKDLRTVAQLATTPVFIWVNEDFPARTLPEMLDLVKARPGSYNYSSSAPATLAHLGSLMFFERAGAQLTHLGYKGSAQALTDFLGGVFPIYFEVGQPLAPHFKAGKARPLAALASRRSPLLPDVPSVAELGFTGLDAAPFINLQAPAAMPAPIVEQLHQHARRALRSAAVRSKLEGLYFEVADGGDPALLGAWQRAESDKWGAVIRSHGLKLD